GHFGFLRQYENEKFNVAVVRSMRLGTVYLGERWAKLRDPLERMRALGAAALGAVDVPGAVEDPLPLIAALALECRNGDVKDGTVATRNPEDLQQVFSLIVAIVMRLKDREIRVSGDIKTFLDHTAPHLRLLRHADGTLARFHGADRGPEGQLDRALAFSGVRKPARSGDIAMGYCRLAAGRTSLISDVGSAPPVQASAHAHSSVLAFELTSGRRPVIVSAGPGDNFGAEWALAGRATPMHSTLAFEGLSQARIAARGKQRVGDPVLLDHGPSEVSCRVTRSEDGTLMVAAHNAYTASHGLWHQRALRLSLDGRQVEGVDLLETRNVVDESVFKAAQDRRPESFAFAIRFHLHPQAQAGLALNGAAVSIKLRSGEVWLLRHDGSCDVTLEPSVWLTRDEERPVASEQIVLSARAEDMQRRMRWTLSKTQDTPRGIRDLQRDDPQS
ncbi:MAG: heparinase II/III-family protein, partial [Deltaproteobacteria bacterium]